MTWKKDHRRTHLML